MLLNGLYEFYQRATKPSASGPPLIEDPAFVNKWIGWRIPLDDKGNLIGDRLIAVPQIKQGGISLSLPRTSRTKNQGGVAEFLWGDAESVFGILMKTDPPKLLKTDSDKFMDFWEQIERAAAEPGLEFLNALLTFRDKYILAENQGPIYFETAADGEKSKMVIRTDSKPVVLKSSDNFTFEINGNLPVADQRVRDYWKQIYSNEVESSVSNAKLGACLVTGQRNVPIAASHMPKIAGVPGATPTGAAIVSFHEDAFCSYGFRQSHNSPVSMSAVQAYTNAFNYLLGSDSHRVKVGPAALVFWAQESEAATDLFAKLFQTPNEDSIKEFMRAPFKGLPPGLDPENERFYSVVVSGNGGRVVIQSWLQSTVAAAIRNFRKWFSDLELKPYKQFTAERGSPLSIYSLARSTLRDPANLRAETVTQLFRAAIDAGKPSMMIANAIVGRIAVDLAQQGSAALNNYSRYALLRLIINRNKKENEPMIETQLTVDTDDPAYNCGRLLALFDDLQAAAHDYRLEGAGVVERYYGTASSSPNSAFGILWRLHQHHLKKLSRSKPAAATAIKRNIAQLAAQFRPAGPDSPPEFPRVFGLAEQGRFALGFYQQWAEIEASRRQYKQDKETQNQGETENE